MLEDIVKNLPFYFFITDKNFTPELISEKVKVDFNISNKKLKNLAKEIFKSLESKNGYSIERKHLLKEKTIYIKWIIKHLKDKIIFTGFDVTERINIEKKLKEQEETYRGILDSILEAIYIQDENGVFLDVNKGAEKMYGYPKEFLIGKTPEVVSAPGKNNIKEVVKALGNAFKGIPQKFEFWGIRKNGEIFPKNVRLYKGKYFGKDVVIAVAEDITEKKKAEEKLKESEEKFRLLTEFSDNIVYWITPDKKLKYISPNCKKITGYSKEEFYNDPELLLKIIVKDDLEKVKHHLKGEVTDEDKHPIEFRIKRKDGKIRWIRHLCRPMFDDKGNFLGRRCSNSDITLIKKLQEKMINTQKFEAIGKLSGGIVHDFNNVLAAISGYADLALKLIDENSKAYRLITNIKNSVKKGESITSKLLSFSKNKMIVKRAVKLDNVLKDFFPILRRLIGEDIKLEFIPSYKGSIYAAPSEIEQIIMNLVLNSRDSILEKGTRNGKIIIKTYTKEMKNSEKDFFKNEIKKGKYAAISINDNGMGIRKEQLDKIFEPFYTSKHTGTGLGLFIVSSIVKESNGFIKLTSKEGEGTKIEILFPQIKKEKNEITEEEKTPIKPLKNVKVISSGKTILFVEDEVDVRDFAVQLLKSLGFTVYSAGNGMEGLKVLRALDFKIDLLITDVVMPIMSGEELAKITRKENPEIKIILISGYTNGYINLSDMKERKFFDYFLKKPFFIEELYSLLKTIFKT